MLSTQPRTTGRASAQLKKHRVQGAIIYMWFKDLVQDSTELFFFFFNHSVRLQMLSPRLHSLIHSTNKSLLCARPSTRYWANPTPQGTVTQHHRLSQEQSGRSRHPDVLVSTLPSSPHAPTLVIPRQCFMLSGVRV